MWCQPAVDQHSQLPGDLPDWSPHLLEHPQEAATGGERAGPVCCSVLWDVKPPSAEAITASMALCRVAPMPPSGKASS